MAGLSVALSVGYLVIRVLPQHLAHTKGLDPNQKAAEEGRVRSALLTFLGGVVLFLGAFYTARTFALSRSGQVTERFTRAVDQLGNEKLEVRLGGIYALDRLARDSREDHGPIMELLAAYLRVYAPGPGRPPAEEIVAATINVLRRRRLAYDRHQAMDLDLSGTDLADIRTENLELAGARLTGAQLNGAILVGANFRRANLIGAQLQGAVLFDAKLNRALLQNAVLTDAHLEGADLRKADLSNADLNGARYDKRTMWPKRFDKAAAGAILVGAGNEARGSNEPASAPPATSPSVLFTFVVAIAASVWAVRHRTGEISSPPSRSAPSGAHRESSARQSGHNRGDA